MPRKKGPKYTKKERKARRRLHRINVPLVGLKEAKKGYKRDVKYHPNFRDWWKK